MAAPNFSHDINARNSARILRLRQRLGLAGYAVYFMLQERLHQSEERICGADYEALSYDFRADAELIRSVVEDYGLFQLSADGSCFRSAGLAEKMDVHSKRSEAGRKGAASRWGKNLVEMAQNGKSDVCHVLPCDSMANDSKNANRMAQDGKPMAKSDFAIFAMAPKSENPNGMAQDGKNSICHDLPFSDAPQDGKNGKQMAQNGKSMAKSDLPCEPRACVKQEQQQDININNSCSCFQYEIKKDTTSDLETAGAPAHVSEPEGFSFYSLDDEQQQREQDDFFEIFFWKDYCNVAAEVQRFINTNEGFLWRNGKKTEVFKSAQQRRAIAQLWTPKGNNRRVGNTKFLEAWRKCYRLAQKEKPDIAHLFLSEAVRIGKSNDINYVTMPKAVYEWITENPERRAKVMAPIGRAIGDNNFRVKFI